MFCENYFQTLTNKISDCLEVLTLELIENLLINLLINYQIQTKGYLLQFKFLSNLELNFSIFSKIVLG